jgi:hypothetical protein
VQQKETSAARHQVIEKHQGGVSDGSAPIEWVGGAAALEEASFPGMDCEVVVEAK